MRVDRFNDDEIAALKRAGFTIAEDSESANIEGASIGLIRRHDDPDFYLEITLPNHTMIGCTLRYDEIIADDEA